MNRRDLFRSVAAAFVAAMVPMPMRRLAADADPSWFAEVPVPEGWVVSSAEITQALGSTSARWAIWLGRFGEPMPWHARLCGVLRYDAQPAETRMFEGTMEGFRLDRDDQMVFSEPRDGVVRLERRRWVCEAGQSWTGEV